MREPKSVLFLGGSITAGASASCYEKSWAALCFAGIKEPLFAGKAEMYNASISGTGSFFAVMRLGQHILPYRPDMVFVEFSVNDLGQAEENPNLVISSLDYLVQTLISTNPNVTIVFVYTTLSGRNASETHGIVAKHYGIPEIDFQTPMAEAIRMAGCGWDRYLADGIHPNDMGHRFYADTAVKTILADPARFLTPAHHKKSIAAYRFANPHIILAAEEMERNGFTLVEVEDDVHIKHLPELEVTRAFTTDLPGASLKVKFRGTHFGVYHRIFTDHGCASVHIDGQYKGTIDCYHRYHPTYEAAGEFVCFFQCHDLSEGEHTAEIAVLNEKSGESTGNRITIAGFLAG